MDYQPELLPAVKRLLEENRGRWPEISTATGVKYRTMQNIAQGVVTDPRVSALERLHKYMTSEPAAA